MRTPLAESKIEDAPASESGEGGKVILLANTDWYLYNFRLPLAQFLRANGMSVVLMCPDGPYCDRLHAAGFRVIIVNMRQHGVLPWHELAVIREVAAIYRRERPSVVHHFTIKCVVYGSLAARLTGVQSRINAVAGLGYVFASRSLRAALLRPLVRGLLRLTLQGRGSRLILQNRDDAEQFRRESLASPAQIRLIRGSGVNTRRFKPRARLIAPATTTVLLASRLLWDKGVGEFIEAARLCREQRKSIRFLLAGAPDPGNPASVQQRDIDQWRQEGIVEALGQVSDMASLLQQVDVVALPTVYGEGVPRILLEAAASGLPLIATRTPGCIEVVHDGVTGLLVEPRSSADLASAIVKLHERAADRIAMGAAARELAIREFDETQVLQRTLEVYRELMDPPAVVNATAQAQSLSRSS